MTQEYQYKITFKAQLLVGLFLAALVAHGSLQGWWIEPTLTSLGQKELFFGSLALTAFNDNAAITYLATLVPNFDDSMKYMVVAGAIAGGGLTVIANAPNPAGISILSKYFKGGVSPVKLILWAAIPTAVLCAAYLL
ncbi:MAG: putative Na+/H+ antiporter [Bacilli bacterium]